MDNVPQALQSTGLQRQLTPFENNKRNSGNEPENQDTSREVIQIKELSNQFGVSTQGKNSRGTMLHSKSILSFTDRCEVR